MRRFAPIPVAIMTLAIDPGSANAQLRCVDLAFIGRAGFGFSNLSECSAAATQLGAIFSTCPQLAPMSPSDIRCTPRNNAVVLSGSGSTCQSFAASLRGALRGNTGLSSSYDPFFTCVGSTDAILADITMASCISNIPRITTLQNGFENAGLDSFCAELPTSSTSATTTPTSTVTTTQTSTMTSSLTSTPTSTLSEFAAVFTLPIAFDNQLEADVDSDLRRVLGRVGLSNGIRSIELFSFNPSVTTVVIKTTTASDAGLIRDLLRSSSGLVLTLRGTSHRSTFVDHLAVQTTPFVGPVRLVFQLSLVGLNRTALSETLQRYLRTLPNTDPAPIIVSAGDVFPGVGLTTIASLPEAAFSEIGDFVLNCTACPTFNVNGTFVQLCGHLLGQTPCGTAAPSIVSTSAPTPLVSSESATSSTRKSNTLIVILAIVFGLVILGLSVWLISMKRDIRELSKGAANDELPASVVMNQGLAEGQRRGIPEGMRKLFLGPGGIAASVDGSSLQGSVPPASVSNNGVSLDQSVPSASVSNNGVSLDQAGSLNVIVDPDAETTHFTPSRLPSDSTSISETSAMSEHYYPGVFLPTILDGTKPEKSTKPRTAEEEANSFWMQ